jgi:hypothetical protein
MGSLELEGHRETKVKLVHKEFLVQPGRMVNQVQQEPLAYKDRLAFKDQPEPLDQLVQVSLTQ